MWGLSLSTSVSDGWRSHQAVQHPDSDVQRQQLPSVHLAILPEPPPARSYQPGFRFLPGEQTFCISLVLCFILFVHDIGYYLETFFRPKSWMLSVVCFWGQQQKSAPICPLDPVELLQQCEEALRDRPPHLHRNFVYINNGDDVASIPIRVMQWNILAQGRPIVIGISS